MSNRTVTAQFLRGNLLRFAAIFCISIAPGAIALAGEHDHHLMTAEPPADEPLLQAPVKVPDLKVQTQDGRKVHFYRDLVKGRTVAVNFIYTTCTAICSPMTANMREVQQLLGSDAGKIEIISITIDPKLDTPSALKAFAQKFEAGPGWTFVTASPATIAKLQKGFAVSMSRKEDHTPLVIIGNDATGKWTRKFGLAHPEVIAAALRQAAGLPEASP